MKSILRTMVSGVSLALVGTCLFLVPMSCGGRTPHTVRMKVGDSIVITPVPAHQLVESFTETAPRKLLLTFMRGGKGVSPESNAIIKFYTNHEASDPFFTLNAMDFPYMHLRTGCSSSDAALLDNATESDVLLCDGSLDVHLARKIELHTPEGKVKRATSVVPESVENDLYFGTIFFQ